MNVNLDREDLINLIKGCEPAMEIWDHLKIKGKFDYSDQDGRFTWKSEIFEATDEELYSIYLLCKESWNIKRERKPTTIEGLKNEMHGEHEIVGSSVYDMTIYYGLNFKPVCDICNKNNVEFRKDIYYIRNVETGDVISKIICSNCSKAAQWNPQTDKEVLQDINNRMKDIFNGE